MDKFEYIEYDLNSQTYVDCETTLYQSYEKKQDGILQYEKVIKDTPSKNSTVVTKEKKKASLSELGRHGWEIAMPITGIETPRCILKRKIEENSPTINLNMIGNEDAYKALSRAAYTGMLMAYDMLEKMGRLPHQQLKQQPPTTKKQDIDHSYDR